MAVAHANGSYALLVFSPEWPCARLWVADSGAGIPTEHQARVFDRFYRVDTGRTRAAGGTGLGLAICRAIAEAHGGTIGLTSRPEYGTRVDLALPAQPAGGAVCAATTSKYRG